MKTRFFLASALILGAVWSGRAQLAPVLAPALEPEMDAIFVSTREVRDLLWDGQALWAATSGGVLRRDSSGWRRWNRQSGLPSHEALEIELQDGRVRARFPVHSAVYDGKTWQARPEKPYQRSLPSAIWQGRTVRATLDGLEIGGNESGADKIALPASNGTHISALLPCGKTLLVAIYGDGLWRYDGQWTREPQSAVPAPAREITALAGDGVRIFGGTRRAGVGAGVGVGGAPELAGEIPNANIQSFADFRGALFASTLDDGLVYRSGSGWNHVAPSELSSSAPRQMQPFQNRLLVRHGGGLVDSFDGRSWTKNAFKTMPRRGVYALAGNEKTLFAAGWGGWSEWDGATWTPHFEVPELKGVPLMGLLLDGDFLWIATQSRGLGRYGRKTRAFRWFDERDGMPDDWITSLGKVDGKIYAGTFVGGLARLDGDKWHVFAATRGQNVTAIVESDGKVVAATRSGIWEVQGDGAVRVEKAWLDSEVQALHAGKSGLWVGTRTSLNWLKLAPNGG